MTKLSLELEETKKKLSAAEEKLKIGDVNFYFQNRCLNTVSMRSDSLNSMKVLLHFRKGHLANVKGSVIFLNQNIIGT